MLDRRAIYRYNRGMQNLEPHKLIEASSLFRNLQAHETANIIARLQPISFTRGERILESGVWHGQLYIIASGLVSILLREGGRTPSTALEEHEPLAVAQLGPGE
ncbi:MAG: hypothetical protein E6I93_13750 [Chloroflexi bacterium]|nr:MAG: hypothetical protein E6I93_13750 [Chloroflexota bacterium]